MNVFNLQSLSISISIQSRPVTRSPGGGLGPLTLFVAGGWEVDGLDFFGALLYSGESLLAPVSSKGMDVWCSIGLLPPPPTVCSCRVEFDFRFEAPDGVAVWWTAKYGRKRFAFWGKALILPVAQTYEPSSTNEMLLERLRMHLARLVSRVQRLRKNLE